MGAIIVLALFLFLAHIVGKRAESRGKSYLGWFLVSLVISPFISFILLLMFS